MSKPRRNSARGGHERHVSVRAVRRNPPDLRKLGRALMELAMSQAAIETAAQQQVEQTNQHEAASDPNDHGDPVGKSDENARE